MQQSGMINGLVSVLVGVGLGLVHKYYPDANVPQIFGILCVVYIYPYICRLKIKSLAIAFGLRLILLGAAAYMLKVYVLDRYFSINEALYWGVWAAIAANELRYAIRAGQMLHMSFPLNKKRYDVFISYKTQDVELARFLAETMMLHGYKVWFAEYTILFDDWFDEQKFKDSIINGIQNAKKVIVITNDPYVDSEYCRFELDAIISKKIPFNVFHIKAPHSDSVMSAYPALDTCRSYVYNGDKVDACRAVSLFLGKKMNPAALAPETIDAQAAAKLGAEPSGRKVYSCSHKGGPFKYSFDFGKGLILSEALRDNVLAAQGYDLRRSQPGPFFTVLFGPFIAEGKVFVGRDAFPGRMPVGKVIDQAYIDELSTILDSRNIAKLTAGEHLDGKNNDRMMYRLNIIFAEDVSNKSKDIDRFQGVHLFFLKGFSHAAYTFQTGKDAWGRAYSLQFPHPDGDYEIFISFVVKCRLFELCAVTQYFDAIVKTLQLDPDPAQGAARDGAASEASA